MSIEQSNDFHVVRRLCKALAPEYRLLANIELKPGESVLDVRRKTVEVAENDDLHEALATLFFQIGHIILVPEPTLGLFFGKGLGRYQGTDEMLINDLAKQGARADRIASEWAARVFPSYFHIDQEAAKKYIDALRWDETQWRDYFLSHE